MKLTLEQQFKLQSLKSQIKTISEKEAKELLLEALRQNMLKDNFLKQNIL